MCLRRGRFSLPGRKSSEKTIFEEEKTKNTFWGGGGRRGHCKQTIVMYSQTNFSNTATPILDYGRRLKRMYIYIFARAGEPILALVLSLGNRKSDFWTFSLDAPSALPFFLKLHLFYDREGLIFVFHINCGLSNHLFKLFL